jgi:hypothetical protein
MVSRVWHGWTSAANADAYEQLLRTTVFPGIQGRRIAGYLGIRLDRRVVPDGEEFVTTMFFESMEAIVAFAGADYETSVVPAAARALLSRFDAKSAHYTVVYALPNTATSADPALAAPSSGTSAT